MPWFTAQPTNPLPTRDQISVVTGLTSMIAKENL